MNYLAHLALAGGEDPALLAGGLLGDFVKGRLRGERPTALERGIALHRHIDARSNVDADISASCARLAAPRRFAPPLVDVLADHLLAVQFEHWQGETLTAFAARVYGRLAQWQGYFPPAAANFFERIREHDVLCGYAHSETIVRIAHRLGQRLRQPGLPRAAEHALATQLAELQGDFDRYYPRLRSAARTWCAGRSL